MQAERFRRPLVERGTIEPDLAARRLPDADEHAGSWWPDWLAWIRTQEPTLVKARQPGGGVLKPLEDAPGSYVMVRD